MNVITYHDMLCSVIPCMITHYMLPLCIACSITCYYMIFYRPLHVLAIHCMHLYKISLVAAAAEAVSARAVSRPFSVGFILLDKNPASSERCEVLAAYR